MGRRATPGWPRWRWSSTIATLPFPDPPAPLPCKALSMCARSAVLYYEEPSHRTIHLIPIGRQEMVDVGAGAGIRKLLPAPASLVAPVDLPRAAWEMRFPYLVLPSHPPSSQRFKLECIVRDI